MPRGTKAPVLRRGEVYGCLKVLRESCADRHGRPRYATRATCCGRERVQHRASIVHAPLACPSCGTSRKMWGFRAGSAA
jgi:hypothetical protein